MNQQARLEALVQAMYSNTSDGLVVLDKWNIIQGASVSFERMFDVAAAPKQLYMQVCDGLPQHKMLLDYLASVKSSQLEHPPEIIYLPKHDGTLVSVIFRFEHLGYGKLLVFTPTVRSPEKKGVLIHDYLPQQESHFIDAIRPVLLKQAVLEQKYHAIVLECKTI